MTGESVDQAETRRDRERIETLAYEYWQARGGPIGSPDVDWNRAEQDVMGRMESASKAA